MDVMILSVGSEILKGRTVNTNAAYIAGKLYAAGFNVVQERTIADGERLIGRALEECFNTADIVIATGGLGPTRDDVTKPAACRFFNRKLVFDQKYYDRLERYFRRLGYDGVPKRSYGQAEVPEGAEVLPNSQGTAPGLMLGDGRRLLVLLPGVPREMSHLIDEEVLPRLVERYTSGTPFSAVVRTVGIGESTIAERIEEELAEEERELLNYYPHGGFVDIVVAAAGEVKPAHGEVVAKVAGHVRGVLADHVYATGEKDIREVIAEHLTAGNQTLAVAESCTGGLLAETLTNIPGASTWFAGGAVTYSNKSKETLLGVPGSLIEQHGAVSEQVAIAMARGAAEKFATQWAVAITGIAGPGGGTEDKPVGTVFIALETPVGQRCERCAFNGSRGQVRHRSTIKATELLWRALRRLSES
ncbi:MAG: competence/damage-inducible protein A [Candidatus Glassbacteria bacterium]|nr:competence/damage-inducible protein A [Candidatus Glassbacteria bacterium]